MSLLASARSELARNIGCSRRRVASLATVSRFLCQRQLSFAVNWRLTKGTALRQPAAESEFFTTGAAVCLSVSLLQKCASLDLATVDWARSPLRGM